MSDRPFRSTGLLDEIVGSALEPAYREQSERTGGARAGRRSWLLPVGAALLGLLAAMSLLNARAAQPEATANREQLAERVRVEAASVATLQEEVATLRTSVTALQRTALESAAVDPTELVALEMAAATVAVAGPGVVVEMDDAESPDADTDPELTRVLDSDVQSVANGLFAAGAEAVAVNGQRLSSLSAIRGAGEAILVNYRPLTRPYRIEAIGDPRRMEAAFATSPAGVGLKTLSESYGIRADISTVADMTLPGAAVATLRYAEATR